MDNTLRFYVAQGRYGWLEMHLHHSSSEAGSVISGTMINISEWQNEVNRWKEKATRDALTGLYNREYFEHAAQTQLEAIRKLDRVIGLDELPDKLQETALLRIANPEASLSDLAMLSDPPMSKSCLSHRLRKLMELAEKTQEISD